MHTDEPHILVYMKELVAAQLVMEEAADLFSFRHALTRQAVYSELLVGERRALHRHIAETIEQRVSPPRSWMPSWSTSPTTSTKQASGQRLQTMDNAPGNGH